jgi:hypothetical protein
MGVGIWILGIGKYEISCLEEEGLGVRTPGWGRKEDQSGRGKKGIGEKGLNRSADLRALIKGISSSAGIYEIS